MAGRPYRGPSRGQPPLHADSMHVAAPPPQAVLIFVTNRWRSYSPVFQIRMEKMKEIKRPPLYRYPHDGSLQRNFSNLILQLLLRGREENRRWWLKLQPINHESPLIFI
ncbi:hypothetical protein B296_00020460 [Ensete ventricosum]|uniref:Uncharacterized protein n=1 Tax=Ensete ventricosum TaxID=4639 RepID=A0A427AIC9_ENSVE|nr:hypothetical protein B296_00020460 [Ensete ventricosum]